MVDSRAMRQLCDETSWGEGLGDALAGPTWVESHECPTEIVGGPWWMIGCNKTGRDG